MPTFPIDLRSDTVTRPTPAMWRAMAAADVGDDVFREDPTVNALEERAAELLGKEAGLLVSSGTQGNVVSLLALVPRAGEIITESGSHVATSEGGASAVIVGATIYPITARPDGTFDLEVLRAGFKTTNDVHDAQTAVVCLENTHAMSIAAPLPPDYCDRVGALAHEHGIAVHVDGARLFNAAVALGVPARDLVRSADTATFCLSKSLGCPVGSVVVGSTKVIDRARRARKMLGGGMRQAGVFAAAGLVALSDGPDGMIERLAVDHVHARRLAEGLASFGDVVEIDVERHRTNFCIFSIRPRAAGETRDGLRAAFMDEMRARGVLLIEYPDGAMRGVPHWQVSTEDIDYVIDAAHASLVAMGRLPARIGAPEVGPLAVAPGSPVAASPYAR